jgi:hypothetical protein
MIKNTKLRSEGVKRARELIYTAERQASRDVGLAGLRLKPGSSQLATIGIPLKTTPIIRVKDQAT